MTSPLPRRCLTWLLLAWLPLAKWGLPPGLLRFALFYAGGTLLAALAVWQEGDLPRLGPLFAAPLRGLIDALLAFAALTLVAALVLYAPLLQPQVPWPAYQLASLFDPLVVYVTVAQGGPYPAFGTIVLTALGALLEEWIFRVALFWRWLPTEIVSRLPRSGHRAGALLRLLAVSAYFALLHWPQASHLVVIAFLGSLVLGILLLQRRSFALVAALHVLFNLRILL